MAYRVRARSISRRESSKRIQTGEPTHFSPTISPQFLDAVAVFATPRLAGVSRVLRLPVCLRVRPGRTSRTLQTQARFNRRSLDRWRARTMKPVAKAEEDRQPLIDGRHLFLRKLAQYAPDTPLVD